MRLAMFTTTVWLTLLGTVALGQKAAHDYDREVDFSKYRRYGWTRGTELTDGLNRAPVVRGVDAALVARGLTRADPDIHPDILVAYRVSFETNLEIDGLSHGWAPGLGGDQWRSARMHPVLVGTLVVDVTDARTGAVVWRSLATTGVRPTDKPETRDKKIARAVEKILGNYPPEP